MGRFALKASRGKFSQLVIDTYTAYLKDPSVAAQKNPVSDRPPTQKLFVLPFTRELPANYFASASASAPVVTLYLAKVNTGAGTRAKEELTFPTEFSLRLDGFRAARINIRSGVSSTGTKEKSKTSGLPYKAYGGHSVSIPFGRSNNTETLDEAFIAIRDDIIGSTPSANSPRVNLISEVRGRVI